MKKTLRRYNRDFKISVLSELEAGKPLAQRSMKAAALAVCLKLSRMPGNIHARCSGRNDRKSDCTYDEEEPEEITCSLMKLSDLSLHDFLAS